MKLLLPSVFDALLFIALPWAIWRSVKGVIPLAVVPILLGMVFSAMHLPLVSLGVPSALGNQLGLLGVILLTFTAGLETRQSPIEPRRTGRRNCTSFQQPPSSVVKIKPIRIAMSAALALAVPFAVGTIISHMYFLNLPKWVPTLGKSWLKAAAIGLCIAVSALPVLWCTSSRIEAKPETVGCGGIECGAD